MRATLLTIHLVGLALAVGAASVKTVLLVMSRSDAAVAAAYFSVDRVITRHILVGIALLALSGVGFLVLGYAFTPQLIAKLALFGAVMVIGPIIDNLVEPKLRALRPATGTPPSPEFLAVRDRHLALEVTATGLFYAVIALWVLF